MFEGINADYIIMALIIVVILLLFLVIIAFLRISTLNKAYKKFMSGRNGESLQEVLEDIILDMNEIKEDQKKASDLSSKAFANVSGAFRKMGVIKYDAFKGSSGRISSAVCLLDDFNNGVIVNIMHGSGSSYTYTKEVVRGEVSSSLSEEEKQAYQKALDYKNKG